jgi:uncharacterized protein (TIGR00255 family)
MLKSMTGFAARDFGQGQYAGSIQLKSYNSRYLDLAIFLPSALSSLEPRVKQMLSEKITRGKVEFSLRLRKTAGSSSIEPDLEAARALHGTLLRLGRELGIEEQPSLSLIASFEGVIGREVEIDSSEFWSGIEADFQEVLREFEASRQKEGQAAEADIFAELERFAAGLNAIRDQAGTIDENITRQLVSRFEEILPKGYDEQRMLQEVAVQLVRASISEEIARLDAHIAAFRQMSGQPAPAKRMDFLCQEMNRETNTIGSKNILVPVAHAVVEMKDALENIREQLRNVE